MKFFILACIAAAIPSIQASGNSANFASTCGAASNQMLTLGGHINDVAAVARRLGHKDIISKCNEASKHLSSAQYAWQGISTGFGKQPWAARNSPHASSVQGSLGACGVSMNWIYGCKNFKHPSYQGYGDRCRSSYDGCQSSCGKVWNWPSPPGNGGYGPKPSGGYSGYNHRRSLKSELRCPIGETACRISNSTVSIECLDVKSEITSCGGCASEGKGENCLAIEGASGVGCHHGKCVVLSTLPGFIKGPDGRPVSLSPLKV